jgi:hypothetical protein
VGSAAIRVSGCMFDLVPPAVVPPAGFEPALTAPERVAVYDRDQRKHAVAGPARGRIGDGGLAEAADRAGRGCGVHTSTGCAACLGRRPVVTGGCRSWVRLQARCRREALGELADQVSALTEGR